MASVIVPTWDDLQELVLLARERLWLCSPYVTDEALGKVFDALPEEPSVRIWTRISPSDWANGVSDPDALAAFVASLAEAGRKVELGIVQRLHAKLYAADYTAALVGSSNLSAGGFDRNLELMVQLNGEHADVAIRLLEESGAPKLKMVRLPQLAEWLDRWRQTVNEAKRVAETAPEVLAPVQADLDHMLGFGHQVPDHMLPEPGVEDLEDFAEWLRANPSIPGAAVIYRRHTNADGQNLTGHVKQSFAACFRFISANPDMGPILSAALERLGVQDTYAVEDPGVLDAWLEHFDAHATDAGESYDYSILRSYLPPSLGGTRLGGGGGSSTFKRMLPLVARYLAGISV